MIFSKIGNLMNTKIDPKLNNPVSKFNL